MRKTLAAAACVASFMAAQAAHATDYTLQFFDVDDNETASITNGTYSDQLILSEGFGATYPAVDISQYVTPGKNTITIRDFNTSPGQGYTYGYDLKADGVTIASDSCGIFNTFGCDNNSSAQGLVFEKAIDFEAPGEVSAAPEPSAWALMMLGVGISGWMIGFRKRVIVEHKAKLAAIG